jgi:hypothetical protein
MIKIRGLNKREFTRYWNRMVKKNYKYTASNPLSGTVWEIFQSEYINTGNIEIEGMYTETGNPVNY